MNHPTTGVRERTRGSAPLPDNLRRGLVALVNSLGETRARERVGLSRSAFARALGGLGVYRGTVALVQAALVESQDQIPDSGAGS